jgi:hypothetical protein
MCVRSLFHQIFILLYRFIKKDIIFPRMSSNSREEEAQKVEYYI